MTYEILVKVTTYEPSEVYYDRVAREIAKDVERVLTREIAYEWPGYMTVSVLPRTAEVGPADGLRWTAAEAYGHRSDRWHLADTGRPRTLCSPRCSPFSGIPEDPGLCCPTCLHVALEGALQGRGLPIPPKPSGEESHG